MNYELRYDEKTELTSLFYGPNLKYSFTEKEFDEIHKKKEEWVEFDDFKARLTRMNRMKIIKNDKKYTFSKKELETINVGFYNMLTKDDYYYM